MERDTITPRAAALIALLGGHRKEGVTLSPDEYAALCRLYGITPEPAGKGQRMLQAGANRNLYRQGQHDGLRLLAWLAPWIAPGEDPLKVLIQAAMAAGWDVDGEDAAWANEEHK